MSVGIPVLTPQLSKILMRLLTFFALTCLTLSCTVSLPQRARAQDDAPQGQAATPADTKMPAGAAESINGKAIIKSGLPIPRFVSLKSDKVYARTGPSMRYPVRWIYQKSDLPVEIVEEFDVWRKIRDNQGEGGWVSQTLLSGERTALIKGEELQAVREKPAADSRMVVRFEPGVVARIEKCDVSWCRVSASGFKGWIERKSLWGIYENEDLN